MESTFSGFEGLASLVWESSLFAQNCIIYYTNPQQNHNKSFIYTREKRKKCPKICISAKKAVSLCPKLGNMAKCPNK